MKKINYHFETLQLHAGQEQADKTTQARAVPIYQSTSYVFDNCAQAERQFSLQEPGYIYSRLANPTNEVFEKRINALEGGVGALSCATGAAAITLAIQNIAHAGDHIVSTNTIYGGTYNLFAHTLKEQGITTTFVNADDLQALEDAIQANTKVVYTEVLGNPNCNLVDIDALANIAHRHKIPLFVDSTFTPPCIFQPIKHGADIVIHSATKFIGGHGTTLGGVIVDSGKFDWRGNPLFTSLNQSDPSYHGICFCDVAKETAFITRARAVLLRDTGATLSPFHSFLFLQGLETLSLRIERAVENTLEIVKYLNTHPLVEKVNHPSIKTSSYHERYKKYFHKGAGSIFTIELKGGKEQAIRFIDSLQIFSLLANVADVKSLVIHPASTTHSQLNAQELHEQGIKENTIRLSIGCEHVEDLLLDLENALASL